MSLLDKFKNSVSNVINDEVNKVTSEIEGKLENAVNDLFGKALKGIGIGGKLGLALQSEFANAIQNAKADKFMGTVTSVSERASASDICKNLTPKFAETAFTANERLKGQNEYGGEGEVPYYQFPQQEMAFYTKLEFKEYVRPSPQTLPTTPVKNTVILPLPKDLEESFGIRLSQDDAGMAGAGFDALTRSIEGSSISDEQRNLFIQAAGKKLNEMLKGQVGQVAGAIPNPYVTVMFSGVDLRTFTFTWKFAPRNVAESKMLQSIIKIIKGSALPSYSGNNFGVLQYPMICKMTLMSHDGNWKTGNFMEGSHPIIGFKNALIENVTVNYAPNGIPSFFAGTQLPTFYQISVTLKEIEYFTAADFGREAGEDKYTDVFGGIYDKLRESKTLGPVIKAEEGLVEDFLTLGK